MMSHEALIGMRVRVREDYRLAHLRRKKGRSRTGVATLTTWPWTCCSTTAPRSCSGTTS